MIRKNGKNSRPVTLRRWKKQPDLVDRLVELVVRGTVTFLFSSRELKINNAVALRKYIGSRAGRS